MGVAIEGVHLERASRVVWFHRCEKMEVIIVENEVCAGEVTVRLGNGLEKLLKFMNPITFVFRQNNTLVYCNVLYPKVIDLSKGTSVLPGKESETIRVKRASIFNKTIRDIRPIEFNGLKNIGLFRNADNWRVS